MKPINYICRFPFAVIISLVYGALLFVASAFDALFMDWNDGIKNFKNFPTDIYDCYKAIMGL
jgi:hypothetical protein